MCDIELGPLLSHHSWCPSVVGLLSFLLTGIATLEVMGWPVMRPCCHVTPLLYLHCISDVLLVQFPQSSVIEMKVDTGLNVFSEGEVR